MTEVGIKILEEESFSNSINFYKEENQTINQKQIINDYKILDGYNNEFVIPNLNISEILRSIPKECFERSIITSFYHVFKNIFFSLALAYIANNYIFLFSNKIVRICFWFSYIYTQGLLYTGFWVLAHECGHQAFSEYGVLNDVVGFILHSYLLVPYFSWKYTHGKHHKFTGNIKHDMVFVPKTKVEFIKKYKVNTINEITSESPINTLFSLLFQQLGGWISHLFFNTSGKKYENKSKFKINHFHPSSPLFEKKNYWNILISDFGILLQIILLKKSYEYFGGFYFLMNWFLPYLFVNHWLVFITYLQHTDPRLPHYDDEKWNFSNGAASTIDRDFGFVGKYLFHNIIETHVLHHFCSRIPFYHARKATKHIKEALGPHYQYSNENMWVALWKSSRKCQYVDGNDGVLMYRSVN